MNLIDQPSTSLEGEIVKHPLRWLRDPIPPTPLVRRGWESPTPPVPGWQAKQWVICQSCRTKIEWGWQIPVERTINLPLNRGVGDVTELADCCGRPECVAALPEANRRDMEQAAAGQWSYIAGMDWSGY